jgi:hypothetical protein
VMVLFGSVPHGAGADGKTRPVGAADDFPDGPGDAPDPPEPPDPLDPLGPGEACEDGDAPAPAEVCALPEPLVTMAQPATASTRVGSTRAARVRERDATEVFSSFGSHGRSSARGVRARRPRWSGRESGRVVGRFGGRSGVFRGYGAGTAASVGWVRRTGAGVRVAGSG